MKYIRAYSLIAALILLAACSKDLDLDQRTYPCEDDADCPSGQICNPEQICVADGPQHTPDGDLDAQDAPTAPDADASEDTTSEEDADASSEPDSDVCSPDLGAETCDVQGVEYIDVWPSVFIVLNSSGSMTGARMEGVNMALEEIANSFASTMRFGLSSYPSDEPDCFNSVSDLVVPIGLHDVGDFMDAVFGISTGGQSPTGAALNDVKQSGWLIEDGDSLDQYREKLVILITDSPTNQCEDEFSQIDTASALLAEGAPVHVIGIGGNVDSGELDAIASAGGTNNFDDHDHHFYSADDAGGGIIVAFEAIFDDIGPNPQVASCTYLLDDPPDDPDDIQVVIADEEAAFDAEHDNGTVTLKEPECDQLRNMVPAEAENEFEIRTNCTTSCN